MGDAVSNNVTYNVSCSEEILNRRHWQCPGGQIDFVSE